MKVKTFSKNGMQIVNLNRRKAIRHKCLDCSGGYFAEVKNCQHTECPLYEFRTGEGKQAANKRSKALRAKCSECMQGQKYEIKECPVNLCSLWPYRMTTVDKTAEIL